MGYFFKLRSNRNFQMKQITFVFIFLLTTYAYDSTLLKECSSNCTNACSVCTTNTSTCTKCQLGYTLNSPNNTCSLNPCYIANCDRCSSDRYVCLKCTDPYSIFIAATLSCYQVCPIANCAKCLAGSTSCSVCNAAYSLYSINNKCIPTPIANCLVVYDFKKIEYLCTLCSNGYKPSSDQTLCIANTCANIMDCVSCTNASICNQCRDGYSFISGKCQPNSCSINNCLYCDNANICLRCQSSYTLNNSQCMMKSCSHIQNCASCKTGSIYCDECMTGYSYNIWTKRCDVVTFKSQLINCSLYQTFPVTGLFACVKCLTNYVFTNANQITCYLNCDANCMNCTSLTMCGTCNAGYSLINGSCVKNVCTNSSGCSLCPTNDTCLLCTDPYSIFDNNTKTCVQTCLLANCKKCKVSSKICEECNTNYAIYSLNGSCISSLISNCMALHDWRLQQFQCTLCTTGYKPSSDQTECIANTCSNIKDCQVCAANSTVCTTCQKGYSFNNVSCVRNNCNVMNCLYCDTSGACLRPKSSYALSGNQLTMKPCTSIPNCIQCKTGSMFCDVCAANYSYNIWTKRCDVVTFKSQLINCSLYQTFPVTGLFACVKCLTNYVFTNANQITCYQNCDANCMNCTSLTMCGVCNPGYSLFNNGCIKNVCVNTTTCSLCTINNTCLQCTDPYSLYNIDSKTCTQYCALQNCKKCRVNSKICEQCNKGYAVYSWDGQCVISMISNCLVLHDWRFQQFQCTRCAVGYKPSQDQTECILSFCQSIPNCQICASSSVCNKCRVGYVFEGAECVRMNCTTKNCLYCNQQGRCLRATSNYTVLGQGQLQPKQCKLANCSACKQGSIFCDACVNGKAFNVWSKACDLQGPSSGPNLKYLWLLSIVVVIIVAVIVLVWVYQKGKNVQGSNKVAPRNDDALQVPNTNLRQEKDTLGPMNNDTTNDNYETGFNFKSPHRNKLPPIRRVQQASPLQASPLQPSEDIFFETPSPAIKQNLN